MGNLRQSMTDKEWDELGEKAKNTPKSEMYLFFSNKDLKTLKKVYKKLAKYYSSYDLSNLEKYIAYKQKE